jgi:hypothetical protein
LLAIADLQLASVRPVTPRIEFRINILKAMIGISGCSEDDDLAVVPGRELSLAWQRRYP